MGPNVSTCSFVTRRLPSCNLANPGAEFPSESVCPLIVHRKPSTSIQMLRRSLHEREQDWQIGLSETTLQIACETFFLRRIHAGMPASAMARGMTRTLATASGPGTLRLQHKAPLLLWFQRSTIGNLSNPRRERAVGPVSRCVTRRVSFARSKQAMAAAGEAAGEEVTFVKTEAASRRNADSGMVAFVTGANRGIGMEVTRQLLARTKGERAKTTS